MTAHPTLQAAAHREPTCDARTGQRAGSFGEEPLWCNVQRGLRGYVDAAGATRRYCSAPRHEGVVRRRYPEPRAALDEGVAVFDAPGCWFCKRTAPILDGRYTAIDFGWELGVQHVCDDCREKAD
jgi:hypothetical protein